MTYLIPLILNIILFFSAYYVGKRLIHRDWPKGVRFLLWSALLLMAFSLPIQFIFRAFWLNHGQTWIIQLLQYAMGLYSILLFFTVIRDVLLLCGYLFERIVNWQEQKKRLTLSTATYQLQNQRRNFLRESTRFGVGAVSLGTFGRFAVNANDMQPTVVSVDVPIQNLPQALEGVRIVQISDVHVGQIRHEQRMVKQIVEAINALNADVIALTGDMTDGTITELRERVAPFAQLKANYGRFFVTGNHEYYTEKAEKWIEEWSRLGFTALQNQHEVLTINGAPLVVAGVHDLRSSQRHESHVCSPQAALQNAPSAPTILLAHHPDTYELAEGLHVDLQLSGHTHAGQYFPGTWIVRWVHKFTAGLHALTNGWIYVNSGTGYWGPALRSTDVLSEITLLTLKRA